MADDLPLFIRVDVRVIVRLFMRQLLEGCGDLQCPMSTCYTHRKQYADRPFRPYTNISARAAAFYLASLGNPQSRLCSKIEESYAENLDPQPLPAEQLNVLEGKVISGAAIKKDPKSFAQKLFDTEIVKGFLSSNDEPWEASKYEKTFMDPSEWRRIDEALDFAKSALRLSTECAPIVVVAMLESLNFLRRCILDMHNEIAPDVHETAVEYTEIFQNDRILMLSLRLTSLLAQLALFKDSLCGYYFPNLSISPTIRRISRMFSSELGNMIKLRECSQYSSLEDTERYEDVVVKYFLAILPQAVIQCFFVDWHGKSIIQLRSPAETALRAMSFLRDVYLESLPYDVVLQIFPFFSRAPPADLMHWAFIWYDKPADSVSLLDFPWLFTTSAQADIFHALCFVRMSRAVEESSFYARQLFGGFNGLSSNPPHASQLASGVLRTAMQRTFALQVSRHDMVDDLFNQLWRREQRELLRPLKVDIKNAGEEGVDQGGVSQEMFQTVLTEVLDSSYGMFIVDPTIRMAWFDPKSLEEPRKYEILGLLFALAIHNGYVLPVTFPLALYKKLLGIPIRYIGEIRDGWPELANGLTQLRDWREGDVGDVFARTYVFSFEGYGDEIMHINMQDANTSSKTYSFSSAQSDDSLSAPLVTNDNRRAFISDYISWLTNKSIHTQFEAFAKGFHQLLPPSVLSILDPRSLQLVTEGQQIISVFDLRASTTYDDYDSSHPTILLFWDVLSNYDDAEMRRLLEFVTASVRLPVNGAKGLQMCIQRNGDDEDRLPTSMTCFSRLLLPEYKDKAKLKEKLGIALGEGKGFGLR